MNGQLALFGVQSIHIGHWSPVTGLLVCVLCKASLEFRAIWDCCDHCRGPVRSAPPWAVLGEGGEMPELEHGREAA